MNLFKSLLLAAIVIVANLQALASDAQGAQPYDATNNSEFLSEEPLQEGFLTHFVNNAISKQMGGATTGGAEKQTYGRNITKFASAPKLGGYIIGSYKYSSQDDANGGPGFGVRLVRVYVDGTILTDFKYRLQVELNGTPHIKDFFIDWSHWKEFGVKIGQFKRCFTFENPYNPWDVGVGDYSQLTKKLSGMGDYNGEPSMGGRDQGIVIHGDLFPIGSTRHRFLHYELGIYNGQGINQTDKNKRKDVIGNIQFQPIKDLFIGAFGWNGNTVINGLTVDRKRWAVGAKYEHQGWSARAEYAHSNGKAVKTADGISYISDNDAADAWYVTAGIPCTKWLKIYGKYDAYRSTACNASLRNIYSLCPNFQLHKNLMFQVQYNYVHDKALAAPSHHELWLETYVRF